MKSNILKVVMLLAAAWTDSSFAADPMQKLDNHKRVVMQVNNDGSSVVHSYTPNGERIKSETSRGERISVSKKGQTRTNSLSASITTNGRAKQ
jgi:exonuclease III